MTDLLEKINDIEKEIKEIKIMIRVSSKDRFSVFKESAGSWNDIDSEKLKKMIYEARGISTRPKVEL